MLIRKCIPIISFILSTAACSVEVKSIDNVKTIEINDTIYHTPIVDGKLCFNPLDEVYEIWSNFDETLTQAALVWGKEIIISGACTWSIFVGEVTSKTSKHPVAVMSPIRNAIVISDYWVNKNKIIEGDPQECKDLDGVITLRQVLVHELGHILVENAHDTGGAMSSQPSCSWVDPSAEALEAPIREW